MSNWMPRQSPPHIRARAEANNLLREELRKRIQPLKAKIGWPSSKIAADAGFTDPRDVVKVQTAINCGIANPQVREKLMAWCDRKEQEL
jgi:hypothetical protein